ncbi:UDP-N-acetylmuramoyl-L-alanine--D-glutamate ligase [Acetobacteraceae bacterium H6797]|nr:UDP-N-acetylmuramoyl-L-alanine--D-glutamate ligase [Acetobacteraceae bacterium H6797]
MELGFTPFRDQRIALLGLGKAGMPAARRLAAWGASVVCWDDSDAARLAAQTAGLRVADLNTIPWRFDALLISPGIPHRGLKAHPVARRAAQAATPILTDAEFLYRALRSTGSLARFAGVTGTNGKSTTTALLAHILAGAGIRVAAGANLGPAATSLPLLGDDGVYVLEMSSYMLERLATLRFETACLLNLSPDHLDRHGDMEGYAKAKRHIFDRQRPQDTAVIGQDDAATAAMAEGLTGRIVPISGEKPCPGGVWAEGSLLRDDAGVIADLSAAPALPGSHNAQNAAAAAAMAFALGVSREAVAEGIRSYPGLPHRQERVGEVAGVTFINDSKATNADSTARALASYEQVVLIAGGVPKAGGIESLAPYFPRIAHCFLIGEAAPAFAATLAAHGVEHTLSGTLAAATAAAAAFARNARTPSGGKPPVLLSPACASFDQFTGFEARGDAFRALVQAMAEGKKG